MTFNTEKNCHVLSIIPISIFSSSKDFPLEFAFENLLTIFPLLYRRFSPCLRISDSPLSLHQTHLGPASEARASRSKRRSRATWTCFSCGRPGGLPTKKKLWLRKSCQFWREKMSQPQLCYVYHLLREPGKLHWQPALTTSDFLLLWWKFSAWSWEASDDGLPSGNRAGGIRPCCTIWVCPPSPDSKDYHTRMTTDISRWPGILGIKLTIASWEGGHAQSMMQ